MLVKQFKFTRNNDRGGFQWVAESEIERPGIYQGFVAVGKTRADVKEFAALVRWCARTGSLERLSAKHPPGFESRMQTTWGGDWYPHKRKPMRELSNSEQCSVANVEIKAAEATKNL
ncbi:MAG: hypothetical protein ABUS49_07425 [Acidobacteriota bacterium]